MSTIYTNSNYVDLRKPPQQSQGASIAEGKTNFWAIPETTWPPIPALIAAWKTIQWATPPYWDYPQTVHQVSALFELMDVNPTVEGFFWVMGSTQDLVAGVTWRLNISISYQI